MQIFSKNEFNIGFTEFVPLSFVAKESPMWKSQTENEQKKINNTEAPLINNTDSVGEDFNHKILSLDHENKNENKNGNEIDPLKPWIRSGPTGVEVILTHAVSRIMLAGHINNIQVYIIK